MKKAVVLLSGGLDSAVTLYIAKQEYECYCLIFDYGQKAVKETEFAVRLSKEAGCAWREIKIDLPWKGSSLLDRSRSIPKPRLTGDGGIPSTYVPARNIIFLSFGVSFAEAVGAEAVFIGANQIDFSNYPDCRSSFLESFQEMAAHGTRSGSGGRRIKVVSPIIDKTKKEIVEIGRSLGVPFERTWSCYKGGSSPCGECESCLLRQQAFDAE